MAWRTQVIVAAAFFLVTASERARKVGMQFHFEKDSETLVMHIEPADPATFKLRALVVLGQDGTVAWSIFARGESLRVASNDTRLDLRGGQHLQIPHGYDTLTLLPPETRQSLMEMRTTGVPIAQIVYGRVPKGFEEDAPAAALSNAGHYKVFVVGTEQSAFDMSPN